MFVLDASVVIALVTTSDAHHREARELLTFAEDPALHPLTLAEVLVAPARAGRAEQARRDLAAAGITVLELAEGAPARLADLRARTGLRLPDCCVADAALQQRAMLATFDRRLAATARDLGVPLAIG